MTSTWREAGLTEAHCVHAMLDMLVFFFIIQIFIERDYMRGSALRAVSLLINRVSSGTLYSS